jgi:hypothetical protein
MRTMFALLLAQVISTAGAVAVMRRSAPRPRPPVRRVW